MDRCFEELIVNEKKSIEKYVKDNQTMLTERFDMILPMSRINLIAQVYTMSICDINGVMRKIRKCYDELKETQAYFCRTQDLNANFNEEATDKLIFQICTFQGSIQIF